MVLNVAILGCGKLGSQIGLCLAKKYGKETIYSTTRNRKTLQKLISEFPNATNNNISAVKKSDIICIITQPEEVSDLMKEIKPYLDKIHKVIITKKKSNESKAFRKCIECGCCIAGAPEITQSKKGCMDPMSLVKIARYVTDPRDGLDRKAMAKKGGINNYSEELGKKLSMVCPRGIPIDEAIALLKK